jgi:hypothetical protein
MLVPAFDRNKVLVMPASAESVRLVIVRLSGYVPDVYESMVTNFVGALVMDTNCGLAGRTPNDQLRKSSQYPPSGYVQVLICARAAGQITAHTARTSANQRFRLQSPLVDNPGAV